MKQKVRGRLVNFRVTDEEFQQLRIACDRQGARCLSAFARKVMLSSPSDGGEDYGDKLAAINRRLSVLEGSMSRMFNALAGSSIAINASEK